MPLAVQLDRTKKRAIYHQIADQIKAQIGQGQLPEGTRLPPVRQLAQELSVTRLTVHNAYSELQAEGWVESIVGRGTFVAEAEEQRMPNLATIGRQLTPGGVLLDMTSVSQTPGLRSLAYAYPDEALLPLDEFWGTLQQLRDEGVALMQYGSTQGDVQLRVELAKLLQTQDIAATPNDIMVTAGATQGLALVAQALAKPGDTALLELPSYFGFSSILNAYGLKPLGVPRERDGVRLDVLERLIIQQRPRFFYLVPHFHNPTGWSMTLKHQQELLAMADHYGLMLIEDDVYGRISYLDTMPLPLKAMDKAGLVIYLSSFSKDLMPGLRVGYVTVPASLHDRIMTLRGAMDMFGPQLLQRAVANYLQQKKFKPHIRRILPIYKERRDALVEALAGWMPDYVQWTKPDGGFTCWLTLPADSRLEGLYQAALSRGVAYSPGSVFMAQPDGNLHLRLCFGNQSAETIRESVILLSQVIRERITDRIQRPEQAFSRMPLV